MPGQLDHQVTGEAVGALDDDRARAVGQQDTASTDRQLLPERYTYHMNTEPYKGQDALKIANEAINWLKDHVEMAERGG